MVTDDTFQCWYCGNIVNPSNAKNYKIVKEFGSREAARDWADKKNTSYPKKYKESYNFCHECDRQTHYVEKKIDR